MKRDYESKKDFIGAEKGFFIPVVKLWDLSKSFIGVNEGVSVPVVQLRIDSDFNFLEGET